MLTLKEKSEASRWETIDLGDGVSLELLLKRPSWSDLLYDSERINDYSEQRFKACVLDWRGVLDEEGKSVPFSFDRLKTLCVAFPRVAALAGNRLAALYYGLAGNDEKNSVAPSGESSGTATAADATADSMTTPSTSTGEPSISISV